MMLRTLLLRLTAVFLLAIQMGPAAAGPRIFGQTPPNVSMILLSSDPGLVDGIRDLFRETRGSARFNALFLHGDPDNIDQALAVLAEQPADAILVESRDAAEAVVAEGYDAPVVAVVRTDEAVENAAATIRAAIRPEEILLQLSRYLGADRPLKRIVIAHAFELDEAARALVRAAQTSDIDSETVAVDPVEWAAPNLIEDIVDRGGDATVLFPYERDAWFWTQAIDGLGEEGVLTATAASPALGAMLEMRSDPYALGRIVGAHLLVHLEDAVIDGLDLPTALARPRLFIDSVAFESPETAPSLAIAKQTTILR